MRCSHLPRALGAEALATGHYARIVHDGDGALLACAADVEKDQAYMLCALAPEKLERVRFPLGELTKPAGARRLPASAGLAVADKRESQDLCFMAGTNRARFLARHAAVRDRAGEIVDGEGACSAATAATVITRSASDGARRRRERAALRAGQGRAANRVVVGSRAEPRRDAGRAQRCAPVPGRRTSRRREPSLSIGPCRLLARGAPAAGEHDLLARCGEPVHGVAPGQTACLLEGDKVLGHGTIAA